jgi:ligand-binding sensor domain-containing protein
MRWHYSTIWLFLLIIIHHAHSQLKPIEDLKFENYSPRNGLPSDYIETITQDKYGFIWLGTPNGLIRYDGITFKTYRHNNTDSLSLPDNDAKSIVADETGKVWLATRNGLFYFNYSTDNFIQLPSTSQKKKINFASSPQLDPSGNLWFYANTGICKFNLKTNTIQDFQIPGITSYSYGNHLLFVTSIGNIYYTDRNNIYQFDSIKLSFFKTTINNKDGALLKDGISAIFESNNQFTWIAAYTGLYLLNKLKNSIQKIDYTAESKTDHNLIINSFGFCKPLTGDSILWCSTPHHGLILLNIHKQQFIKTYQKDNYDNSSIGGSLCYANFTGRDGIFWVSHINGLSKLDWHNQQIKSYQIKEMADSNDVVPPIRKIIKDKKNDSNYWLITWGNGILYYNKPSNKVLKRYLYTTSSSQPNMQLCYDACYDDAGKLWIGYEYGVCYYSQQRDAFERITAPKHFTTLNMVVERMVNDHKGNLWLGTDAGLLQFNISNKIFNKYISANQYDSSLFKSAIYAMHFDHQNKLYIGTRAGLYTIDTLTKEITVMIRPVGVNKTDFNINYVWGIDVDKENNIWVTTRGNGLYKFNPRSKIYSDYFPGRGLTTKELRDVFVDSLQNVWVSSYDGIFKLNTETNFFNRFTPEDGLDNFNISLGRWNIIDNKIFSGSPGAFSIIDPYAKPEQNVDFPVWITGLKLLNRPIFINPEESGHTTIPLSFTENTFTIEFTAINYTKSAKIQYAYLLKGFDKDWQYAGNAHAVNYNNLKGGNYTFIVKAMNGEGNWSHTIATMYIELHPAFWQTTWFLTCLLLCITGIAYLSIKKRIARIRKDAALKQQQQFFRQKILETEMVALRAQMNPHFIFNCMNIIDGLITNNKNREAQEFLQQFSKLIRLVLENSQYQQVLFQQDLLALELYIKLEIIRNNQLFSYQFDVDQELLENDYKIPPLLLQPYIENAIVHGLRNKDHGRGWLLLRIKKQGENIVFTIEDNGIGRKKAQSLNIANKKPHQPMGMQVTEKRIILLQKLNKNAVSVTVSNMDDTAAETGTRVIITLPEHLNFEG